MPKKFSWIDWNHKEKLQSKFVFIFRLSFFISIAETVQYTIYAFQFLNPNEAHMIFFKFCFRWSSKFELFRFLVLKSMFFNFLFAASTLSFLLLKIELVSKELNHFGGIVSFFRDWAPGTLTGGLLATCQCYQCPISEKRRDPPQRDLTPWILTLP